MNVHSVVTAASPRVITFDGPSGVGKTTGAQNLAGILRGRGHPTVFHSTGWVWRLASHLVIANGIDPEAATAAQVIALLERYQVSIECGAHAGDLSVLADGDRVIVNTHPIVSVLYSHPVVRELPHIASLSEVRRYLNNAIITPWISQQSATVIVEGRDTIDVTTGMWRQGQLRDKPVGFMFEHIGDLAGVRSDREDHLNIARRDANDAKNMSTETEVNYINTAKLNSPALAAQELDRVVGSAYPDLARGSVVITVGPPRSGKGTQAAGIASGLGGCHISSGDLLRSASLGADDDVMRRGGLVSPQSLQEVLSSAILATDPELPLVLDGVARRPEEAPWLLNYLTRSGRRPSVMAVLDIDEATMRARHREGRDDDDPAVLDRRWAMYADETSKSIAYLSQALPATVTVDGRGSFATVRRALEEAFQAIGLPLTK